ncbi:hypothetical protein DTO012A8_10183 [Penicillium roqueforti]|nr:hypothetical protein DTO012A8_10183 [Penicillium roqueforti]
MFFIGATVDINLDLQKRKMALNISIHEPFPFLDLPLELRLIIYKFLLSFDEIYIEKRVRDRDVDPHRSGTWMQHNPINNPLAIMSVSRQIYDEARRTFYGLNTFTFGSFYGLPVFLIGIGAENAMLLRQPWRDKRQAKNCESIISKICI